MKKNKEKVLKLGYSALSNWETLLFKEGYITESAHNYDFHIEADQILHSRVDNKKFLLFAMMLFDKIDATYLSMFNMDRLVEMGIIEEHSRIVEDRLDNLDEVAMVFEKISKKDYNNNTTLFLARDTAKEIMLSNKEKIIKALVRKEKMHYGGWSNYSEASSCFSEWLDDCELWATEEFPSEKSSLGIVKESIIYGIYDSIVTGSTYYDGTIKSNKTDNNPSEQTTEQDIVQIMNLDLSTELYQLPRPTTVAEALKLRNRPEIISFRKVFFEWCKAIRQGDIDMTKEIKKDIVLAQKSLDKYYKWEKSNTPLYNCILDVVVNNIPVLSNIIGSFKTYHTNKILRDKEKNSWIMLLK